MPVTKKPPIVIYHGPTCFDGFTAAWVFKQFRPETEEFIPVQYGDAQRPTCRGREVWVLDFSYPRPVMKEIIVESERTFVLDHHKTAEAVLSGLMDEIRNDGIQRSHDKLIFDMNHSGAGMVFDFMEAQAGKRAGRYAPRFNGRRANWLVDMVEDRDLWKFAVEGSREVNAYLATRPMTFESWDKVAAEGEEKAIERGRIVMDYIDQVGEKVCKTAKVEKIGGHEVPTVVMPYMNCSEHLDKLAIKNPEAPFVAGFFRREDGKWQFSLRSRSGFDVSEVARAYGGGGHAPAAGFECAVLPWEMPTELP